MSFTPRLPSNVNVVVYNTPVELANLHIRASKDTDAPALTRLLESAVYAHWHVDGRLPADWLGSAGFVLAEDEDGELAGCLAAVPDPPPAAWVRVAAIRHSRNAQSLLAQMWEQALDAAYEQGVATVAWLQPHDWPVSWLPALRLRQSSEIESYAKEDDVLPQLTPNPALRIRPVHASDFPALVQIEAAAFEPIWRHSEVSLRRSFRSALSFQVAEIEGRLAGFQYCVLGQEGLSAHLVRLTIDPAAQGQRVGSALLADMIRSCWDRRLTRITLNTQIDNLPSHRLYAKFGFFPIGNRYPVWTYNL